MQANTIKLDYNSLERFTVTQTLLRLNLSNNKLTTLKFPTMSNLPLRVLNIENNPNLHLNTHHFEQLYQIHTLNMDATASSDQLILPSDDDLAWVINLTVLKINTPKDFQALNTIPTSLQIPEPFLNLHKLDLSNLNLHILPDDFASFFINLRDLNLSYNNLSVLTPIIGIPKLEKLHLYYNQFGSDERDNYLMSDLILLLQTNLNLKLLDLRFNPFTREFYSSEAIAPDSYLASIEAQMIQVRASGKASPSCNIELPLSILKSKIAYQGLLVASSPQLKWLDGIVMDTDTVEQIREKWNTIVNESSN